MANTFDRNKYFQYSNGSPFCCQDKVKYKDIVQRMIKLIELILQVDKKNSHSAFNSAKWKVIVNY